MTTPASPPPAGRPKRRQGRLWGGMVDVVRASGPPTTALGTWSAGDADVSQRHARAVIDLALRIGEAMLATGAGAADCVATVLRLIQSFGIRSAHVDITYTSITVSMHRGLHEDPLSVMRVIQGRSLDYTRLEAVQRLVDAVVAQAQTGQEPDVDAARAHLTRLLAAPHPFRRWVVTAGYAVMAAGVVMLLGAQPGMWLVAAVAAATVDRVQRALYRAGVAAFFTQAVSAAVPALMGMGLQAVRQAGVDIPGVSSPELVVISGIVVLLAGLGVFGAAQDALDGYYVTAGARGMEVVFMTLGITVGVAAVIGLANRLGIVMEVSGSIVLGGAPLLSAVGAMLAALGFALSTYASLRATVVGILVAGLSWLVLETVLLLGLTGSAGVAVAAALVGATAYASYRRLRVPEVAVATPAIVAMLPGLAVYRSIYLLLQNNPALVGNAMIHLISAVATGIGLAAGLSAGGFVARNRLGLDRAGQRARRRSRGRVG